MNTWHVRTVKLRQYTTLRDYRPRTFPLGWTEGSTALLMLYFIGQSVRAILMEQYYDIKYKGNGKLLLDFSLFIIFQNVFRIKR